MKALWVPLGLLVAGHSMCNGACEMGSGPTPVPPTPTPTASPSPSASPTPTPTPVNCVPDWLRVEGSSVLAKNESRVYWLTPMQTIIKDGVPVQVPVLDSCNIPREHEVEWSFDNGDRLVATMKPDGFKVEVTRVVGPGIATTAPTILLRVQFGTLYAVKPIS